jgi:polysaccharide biosynthesis/export protein
MNRLTCIALFVLIAVGISSCNKHSQLLYMQSGSAKSAFKSLPLSYRIGSNDELYIQVTSMLNKDVNNLFSNSNSPSTTQGYAFNSEVGVYINTYSVNDSGYVEVPLIGKIQAAGKTIPQLTEEVKRKASEYVNDAIIIVKLMSFRVTVIGEVKRPAVITNYHDKLTILEAIAQAGDMTDYANRKMVTLVRNINGESTTMPVDLSSNNILSNPGYYLQPGDVVVVDPRKGKTTQMNIPTYAIFLSTITTVVLMLNYIVK